ncbi:13194_t:CDS:10, partial [Ambispora gerdemannii]
EDNKLQCSCDACKNKKARLAKLKAPSSLAQRINKTAVAVVIGWILFGYLVYKVSTVEIEIEVWDPYEILGVSEGTPLEQIKKVFKKLSLQWHPDKAPEGQKMEHETKFIDITKAYKVLTDEDIRKNYEEWGHPDGKQAYSLGIALPTWLVEAKNNIFVLGIYGVVFGLLLPFFVGRWWYGSTGYTKDKIRTHTMAFYFKELREKSSVKHILELLSASVEFLELVEQRPSDAAALSPVISSVKEELDRRFGEKFEKSKKYTAPYCQKANVLLHAYLLRIKISDATLLKDQEFIIEKVAHLINGILDISLAHQWLTPTINCLEIRQLLTQAIWPGENPLAQLPYINHEVLKAMKSKKRNIKSVVQLREMNEEDRRALLRILSDNEYEAVKNIADAYPALEITRALFKVPGDNIITTGSIVTFILRVRLIESNGEHIDSSISSSDDGKDKLSKSPKNPNNSNNNKPAINGYHTSESESEDDLLLKKKKPATQNNWIHAPYFPLERRPYWYIFIAEEKPDRLIVNPIRITGITNEERTVRIQFQAPPVAGATNLVVYIKSDSYVGSDIRKEVKLEVLNFDALPPEEPIDDEISEPEEDSIAGQMKLMREQGLTAAVAGGTGEQKNDSESSDSDDD